jgi:hypothetical protein
MKLFRIAPLAAVLFFAAASQARAIPATFIAPKAETHRAEIQRVCHHYRWSSRAHCTSAQVLHHFYGRPMHYPHKYYGGTPHYFARQPVYWHAHPAYYHRRWYYWRHRHHPFYW